MIIILLSKHGRLLWAPPLGPGVTGVLGVWSSKPSRRSLPWALELLTRLDADWVLELLTRLDADWVLAGSWSFTSRLSSDYWEFTNKSHRFILAAYSEYDSVSFGRFRSV